MSLPIIKTPAQRGSPWSKAEIAILRKLYGTMSNAELAKLLPGRSAAAVQRFGHHLGLAKSVKVIHLWRTKDGLAKLTELFATMPTLSSVASEIGINHNTLSRWVNTYHDIAKAAEEGRALAAARDKPKEAPKPKKLKGVKPKEPQHKCATCEWARKLVDSGRQVLCIWPTGCEREEGPCSS